MQIMHHLRWLNNALTKHYNLEQQNVNTSAGTGNVYTPITHHNNDYVDPNLIGKHLVEDHSDKNMPKPILRLLLYLIKVILLKNLLFRRSNYQSDR